MTKQEMITELASAYRFKAQIEKGEVYKPEQAIGICERKIEILKKYLSEEDIAEAKALTDSLGLNK